MARMAGFDTGADFETGGGTGVLIPRRPHVRGGKRRGPPRRTPPPPPPEDPGDGGGGGGDGGRFEGPGPAGNAPRADVQRFGLALALVVIATLFAVFLAAWLFLGRDAPGSRPDGVLDLPFTVWTSTLALIASSWTLARAAGARQGRMLILSLLLGLAFLTSQALLWRTLVGRGFVPSSGGTMAAFYAVTGLHALHVLGGLATMTRALWRSTRGLDLRESIRLCATYWHFMGILWIVICATFAFSG